MDEQSFLSGDYQKCPFRKPPSWTDAQIADGWLEATKDRDLMFCYLGVDQCVGFCHKMRQAGKCPALMGLRGTPMEEITRQINVLLQERDE